MSALKIKVLYEWIKQGSHSIMRRIELVTKEDLEKKPEIKRDTDKHPAIPTDGARRRRWMELTDKKEHKRHHGKSY